MRRREFISLCGGAVVTWPLAARAQQPAMSVVGYLHSSSPERSINFVSAFRRGLSESGFVEGKNLAIEFRWAAGKADRLPELAADLVRRRVDVIATPANTAAALAAKAATKTIPIIFSVGSDPIAMGLVKSFSRPGGNATGISFQSVELVAKRLGLLRQLTPKATRFFALVNRNAAYADAIIKELQASSATLGLSVEIIHAGSISEVDVAFVTFAQNPGSVLLISPDPFFLGQRSQIVTLAARHAIPTIYYNDEFPKIGGLVSYGPDIEDVYQQTGVYTGRILKGEKPADLPVVQPTKFELVINHKTAKTLGLTVPASLLATADDVIE